MSGFKTYAQLTVSADVQDGDLWALYRGTGPLKSVTSLVLVSYLGTALATSFLTPSGNLAGLGNAATARTNLGLGTAATHAATDFLLGANNLNDIANAATARGNLGAAASTSPVITGGMTFTGSVAGNVVSVAATTLDVSAGEYQLKTISANTTFTLSGQTAGKSSGMLLELTTSASAQPTFTAARASSAAFPTLGNGTHLIALIYSGSAWTAILIATQIA